MSRSTTVIDDSLRGVSEERAQVLGDLAVGVAMGSVIALIEPPSAQRLIVGFRAGIQLLIKVDFSVVHGLTSASEAPVSQLIYRKLNIPYS